LVALGAGLLESQSTDKQDKNVGGTSSKDTDLSGYVFGGASFGCGQPRHWRLADEQGSVLLERGLVAFGDEQVIPTVNNHTR
jgi:hypothetical protein